MDFENPIKYNVELRWDGPGKAAGPFRPGFVEFSLDEETRLPFLRAVDLRRADKPVTRVSVKELKCLPTCIPRGVDTSFPLRSGNIYLKFPTNEDLRKFYETVKELQMPNGPISLATACPRRSPRNVRNEASKTPDPAIGESTMTETDSIIHDQHQPQIKDLPKIRNSSARHGERGAAADSENIPCPGPKKLSSAPVADGSVFRNLRTSTLNVDSKPKLSVAPLDKENQHRTPVKPAPNQQNCPAEKRTPLSVKGASELKAEGWLWPEKSDDDRFRGIDPREPGPSDANSQPRQFRSMIPKRAATAISTPTSSVSKKHKINDIDNDVSWKNLPRSTVSHGENSQLRGFSNLGNTCYMNVILQALFALYPFAKELMKCYKFFNPVPDSSLFSSMAILLGVKDSDNQSLKVDLLHKVKSAISSTAKRFSGNEEQDAHELLSILLDQLKEEINHLAATRIFASVPPPNPVQSNFEFSVCHYLECQDCHDVSRKEEQFHDLWLDISSSYRINSPQSLQRLLDMFFQEESVCHKCEKCSSESAVIFHKFTKLPRILTLNLKRYTYSGTESRDSKIAATISFPRYLSLRHLCTDSIAHTVPLTESTKKTSTMLPTMRIETSSPTPSNGSGEKARRQLRFDDAPEVPMEPVFAFRKLDTATSGYNTRSATRSTYLDEERQLAEVLERSKYETGPMQDDLDDEVREAMRRSLLELSGSEMDVMNFDSTVPQTDEDVVNDTEDPEMRLNAEDGHLEPAFRLCGVVNHIGARTESGHYICDIFDTKNSSWRSCNDWEITETMEEYVRKNRMKTAYIFFYIAKSLLDDAKRESLP